MKLIRHSMLVTFAAALLAASPALFAGDSAVVTQSQLKWADMGNGITTATVSGDMKKGASRFFLKYPAGLVTPKHHHSADHYVTVISGSITLTADGKDHKLGPGDYFSLSHKATHAAKVEGKTDAVMFIQADAPWDVVMDK